MSPETQDGGLRRTLGRPLETMFLLGDVRVQVIKCAVALAAPLVVADVVPLEYKRTQVSVHRCTSAGERLLTSTSSNFRLGRFGLPVIGEMVDSDARRTFSTALDLAGATRGCLVLTAPSTAMDDVAAASDGRSELEVVARLGDVFGRMAGEPPTESLRAPAREDPCPAGGPPPPVILGIPPKVLGCQPERSGPGAAPEPPLRGGVGWCWLLKEVPKIWDGWPDVGTELAWLLGGKEYWKDWRQGDGEGVHWSAVPPNYSHHDSAETHAPRDAIARLRSHHASAAHADAHFSAHAQERRVSL